MRDSSIHTGCGIEGGQRTASMAFVPQIVHIFSLSCQSLRAANSNGFPYITAFVSEAQHSNTQSSCVFLVKFQIFFVVLGRYFFVRTQYLTNLLAEEQAAHRDAS